MGIILLILFSPWILSAFLVVGSYLLAFWIFPGGGSRGPHDTIAKRVVGFVLVIFGEWLSLAWVFAMTPFKAIRPGPPSRKLPSGRVPVAIVPGLLENVGTLVVLQKRLERSLGVPVRTLRPTKYFNSLESLAQDYLRQIDAWMKRNEVERVDLVSHGMGGLIARYLIESKTALEKVRNLVTIGTPHQGTAIAILGMGRSIRQMKRGSAFLEKLNSGPTLTEVCIIGISSTHDNFILPWNCSLSPRGENFIIRYRGHTMMLFSKEVVRLVTKELKDN
jgi:hypothetical protein